MCCRRRKHIPFAISKRVFGARTKETYRSTKRPYIYSCCPWYVEYHLRGTVDWCANCVLSIICRNIFRNRIPKVTNFNVAKQRLSGAIVSKEVIRFDVCKSGSISEMQKPSLKAVTWD